MSWFAVLSIVLQALDPLRQIGGVADILALGDGGEGDAALLRQGVIAGQALESSFVRAQSEFAVRRVSRGYQSQERQGCEEGAVSSSVWRFLLWRIR